MAKALVRTPREVDALYACLETVGRALDGLEPPVPWTLVAGSLLGALRSQSFLFCDDDIDIAVFERDYARVLADLPAALGKEATLTRRPFPAADRIRPRNCTQVWIDLFVLRRFESMDEVRQLVACKANGATQQKEADAVIAAINSHGAPTWPLYHYDNRLALQLWPREYWTPAELLPLQRRAFGHLHLPTPARPIRHLKRAYGKSCFEEYVLPVQHGAYHAETAARLAQMGPDAALDEDADAAPWPRALQPLHFAPVTHSEHRPPSLPLAAVAARAALLAETAADDAWSGAAETDPSTWPLSPPPSATPSSSTSSKHLGASLAALTCYSQEPFDFSDPRLVAALEPHVAKARAARQTAKTMEPRDGRRPLPRALTTEGQGQYSQSDHPLADRLAAALGLTDCPDSATMEGREEGAPELLAALHTHAPGKHAATARLRDEGYRAGFHAAYDAFVQRVVLPYLASLAAGGGGDVDGGERGVEMGRVRVQSFPCLRLILPGEFSLGAHCDTRYGHDPANINLVVPLTPAGASCASLYAESAPGREDWHPVGASGPGTFSHFHGGQCLHWTSENHSGATRASLDFRVLWAGALAGPGAGEERAKRAEKTDRAEGPEGPEGPAGDKYLAGSYYCEWECWEGVWRRCGASEGALPAPDERVGYPFVGVRPRPRG